MGGISSWRRYSGTYLFESGGGGANNLATNIQNIPVQVVHPRKGGVDKRIHMDADCTVRSTCSNMSGEVLRSTVQGGHDNDGHKDQAELRVGGVS
jgi:hypothetical protein